MSAAARRALLQFASASLRELYHLRRSWVLAATLTPLVGAQTIGDKNAHVWFMYFGDHTISNHWGIHLEGQVRRADTGLTWQQLLLRTGANFQLNSTLMFTAGYAYVRSWPYGDYPSKGAFPEHRFYEQALIKHKVSWVDIQHRLRLEQRLMGPVSAADAEVEDWQTRNRFRYMLRGDIPLSRKIQPATLWHCVVRRSVLPVWRKSGTPVF